MAQITAGTLGWVALGGALGAVSRYLLGEAVQPTLQRATGLGFAWGTLTVNFLGCFLIGLAYHLTARTGSLPHEVRFLVVVGFLGALTTFSTFSLENVNFLRDGQWGKTAAYLAISNVGGIALCFAGYRLSHLLGHLRSPAP